MVEALPQERLPHARLASRGFTLTELLIAAALSLVVMGAVAGLFDLFGRSVRQSQATVELGSLMRSAAWQLRQDLTGVTCPVTPWLSVEQSAGYFELLEGPARDATYALDGQRQPTTNLTADTDDILLFTTQSLAGPFVGRYAGSQIESPYAEVAWFCRRSTEQPVEGTTLYDLHRRQLLVINYLGRSDLANNALPITADHSAYDLSLRTATIPGTGNVLLPNSLGDLMKRENRFLRAGYSFVTEGGTTSIVQPQPFPHAFPVDATHHAVSAAGLAESRRAWEDVILTRVVSFDVRVYDPQVVIRSGTGEVWSQPGDPTYEEAGVTASGPRPFTQIPPDNVTLLLESDQTGAFPVGSSVLVTATATISPPPGPLFSATVTRISFDPITSKTRAVLDKPTQAGTTAGTLVLYPAGAYVDLGWGGGNPVLASGTFPPVGQTALQSAGLLVSDAPRRAALPAATYDTWSRHYEANGVDDDGDGIIDEGTNGIDTDGDGWTSYTGALETSPPYPVPLRGLEVRVRCYEPTSRQVRQITIRHSFLR